MPPLGPACEAVNLTIDELRPAVTLLVDQSGSMREGYPLEESEQTRWMIVREALLDPTNGVVPSLQQSIQFDRNGDTPHQVYFTEVRGGRFVLVK